MGDRLAAFSAEEQIEFALGRAHLNLLIPIADSIFFASGALYGRDGAGGNQSQCWRHLLSSSFAVMILVLVSASAHY